ncbi:MAG: PfkB family carbohydrate kinase [Candidatus Brocadiia bacterium]
MSLLVVGSIAYDNLETPYGKRRNIMGGSAVYFSFSASLFSPVRLVGVVGEDFSFDEELESMKARKIDMRGLHTAKGKTFTWTGRYVGDMSQAETLSVELGVFGKFQPVIPNVYKDSKYIFLANGSPKTQKKVLDQIKRPALVVADTMNFWISNEKKSLIKLIENIDGLIVNSDEVKQLTGMYHIITGAREILKWGPRMLIIKKGEHGALLVTKDDFFAIPGYPVEVVRDPTGAGDSFAGGMMGYLASTRDLSARNLKKSLLYGNVVASFTIEDFGVERLKQITPARIAYRYKQLLKMITL